MIEQEFEQMRAQLAAIVEFSEDAIFSNTLEGIITSWNKGAETLFGYCPEEVIGRSASILIPAGQVDEEPAILQELKQGGRFDHYETVRCRKDGKLIHVSLTVSALHAAGKIVGASKIVRDITGLRKAERHFRLLLESAPDAIVIADGEGKIVLVNSQTEKLFGYSRDEIIGKSGDILVPERLQGNYRAMFFKAAGKGTMMNTVLELHAIGKDGTEFPVEINLSNLDTEEGILVSSSIRNVSERKLAEQRLSEFYAILAHELRTPLASIQGSLDLIVGRVIKPEQEVELMEIARTETRRMLRLINDLLDLEKIEAGAVNLKLAPVPVKQMVDKAIDSLRGMAMESEVKVVADATSDIRLRCDEDRIIQVLTNLLSNAIKFSPAHSVVEIVVKSSQADIKFQIKDQGPGIAEQHLEKLFHKFTQGAKNSGRYAGTGLGLAIAKSIVEQHGGKIGVESKIGVGSTLWFTLPDMAKSRRSMIKHYEN